MTSEIHTVRKYSFSRILAAAIAEALPGAQIEGAGLSCHGFYCDFFYSFPLSAELLERLEERIRQIIREDREIRLLEMVPFSASELLKQIGQKKRAAQLQGEKGLVSLFRMGEFADWFDGFSLLPSTGGAGVFKLLAEVELDRGAYRVFGVCADSKKELKKQLIAWDGFEKKDHEVLGENEDLWCKNEKGERLWLPKGVELRQRTASFWVNGFSSFVRQVKGGERSLELLAKKVPHSMELLTLGDVNDFSERGLLDQGRSLALSINSFFDLHIFCTSFLQTIHKRLTILGFDYRVRCLGRMPKGSPILRSLKELEWSLEEGGFDVEPKLEIMVQDPLYCEWVVAEISERKLKQMRGVSALVWVERNLALLIEKSDGKFPFYLDTERTGGAGELIEN